MKRRRYRHQTLTPTPTLTQQELLQSLARLVDAAKGLEAARRELREARAELRSIVDPLLQDGDVSGLTEC